jgi:hypothetical protein
MSTDHIHVKSDSSITQTDTAATDAGPGDTQQQLPATGPDPGPGTATVLQWCGQQWLYWHAKWMLNTKRAPDFHGDVRFQVTMWDSFTQRVHIDHRPPHKWAERLVTIERKPDGKAWVSE